MSLFHGKVLSGKKAGNLIDVDLWGAKIGIMYIQKGEIKSYQMIGSVTKPNFFGISPVKGYYQLLLTRADGETSIVEVDAKAMTAITREIG